MNIISKNKDFIVNEDIREKEIRVISHDGEQLGVIPTKDALKIAEEKMIMQLTPHVNLFDMLVTKLIS